MTHSPLARALTLASLAALASGCTAGAIVDQNFRAAPIQLPMNFVPVDANGHPTGPAFVYTPPTNGGWEVSFDPYVPSSSNVNGTGIPNVSTVIPPGNYVVTILAPGPFGWVGATSPVFHHDFYSTCTDQFTNKSVTCAPYYFQLTTCSTWQCVNGTSAPQTTVQGGIRVIQLLVNPSGGTAGVLQNNW